MKSHLKLFHSMLCTGILLASPQDAGKSPEPSGDKRPWSNVASLSFVNTSGNSEGSTLGFSNEFTYRWTRSTLVAKGGLLRVASASVTRSASGSSLEEAAVTETREWKTTAENYFLNLRNDNRLRASDRWYWYAGLGWERNRPAGLEDRFAGSGGFGHIFVDSPLARFRADLGLGFTDEIPVVESPDTRRGYWTANLNAELKRSIGGSAGYTLELNVVEDLTNSPDRQITLKQGLSAAINRSLALKVGYELKHRNRPNLIAVTVHSHADSTVILGNTYIPARKLDTLLTTSLVATF